MRTLFVLALLTFGCAHHGDTQPAQAAPATSTQTASAQPTPLPATTPTPTAAATPTATPTSTALPQQGAPCTADGKCADGLTCLRYRGIAGARGPALTSCEIPCRPGGGCPAGQACITIADGPGQVCRPSTKH